MPPYNHYNNNSTTIKSAVRRTNDDTGGSSTNASHSSNNNSTATANMIVVPNRMSNFQKSIDDGRHPMTQQQQQHEVGLMAETVGSSSGSSSLTSQPRPSSSSMVSVQQPQPQNSRTTYMTGMNHHHKSSASNTSKNNHNRMSTPSSPSQQLGKSYNHHHHHHHHSSSVAMMSESSVIFQKSAGLSKLLAPSSPKTGEIVCPLPQSPNRKIGQEQQHRQQRNNNENTTLDEANTSTTSSSSSPMTSTRYASSIRRNRILQRSLSPHTSSIVVTGTTSTFRSDNATRVNDPLPDLPNLAVTQIRPNTTTTTTSTVAALSPASDTSDRRNQHHRMLRQSRRPSSMYNRQRSSLSPPSQNQNNDHATTTTRRNNNHIATTSVSVTTPDPPKKKTSPIKAASSATTVAAAMIAAAASRRLEKSLTTSPKASTSPKTSSEERNQSNMMSTMTSSGRRRPNDALMSNVISTSHNNTATNAAVSTHRQSLVPAHLQQPHLSPTTTMRSSPRSGNYQNHHQQQQQYHTSTTELLPQQPILLSGSPVARVRNRQVSPKVGVGTQYQHHHDKNLQHVDHYNPRPQQYSNTDENNNYHDVVDTASSLSPKDRYESIQQQQHQTHYDGEYHEHHSLRMTHHHRQQQQQQIPTSPPNVQRSQRGQQFPELPSLIPAIGNDPYPNQNDMNDSYRLQQMMDQRTVQRNYSVPRSSDTKPMSNSSYDTVPVRHRSNDGDVTPNKGFNPDGHSMATINNSPMASPYSHYPVPRSSKRSNSEYNRMINQQQRHPYSNNHHRLRNQIDDTGEEEKKFSEPVPMHQSGLHRTSSSSDYETDGSRGENIRHHHHQRMMGVAVNHKGSALQHQGRVLKDEPTFSNLSASQVTPDVAAFFEQSSGTKSRSIRDDDTYDYGDRDDDHDDDGMDDNFAEATIASMHDDTDSQGSLSYEQRRKKLEREQEARAAAVAAAKAEMEGPFMKQDDVEHYRKVVDTPLGRTAAGVAAAATIGCILLGPVGLFLGVAAVGIGVGYMQIPEEQRQNMNSKVTDAMKSAQESAIDASEKLSVNCLTTYKDSGISEHVPVEMETCCVNLAGLDGTVPQSTGNDDDESLLHENESGEMNDKKSGNVVHTKSHDKRKANTPTHSSWHRGKSEKISCLRKGKIVPVAQIHALDPSAQPRAWLDVLANADTSSDEKIEAMEEVLILAKDKQKSRIFVDEGILDCLLWVIGRFKEKQKKGPGSELWANPDLKPDDQVMVKLAANCCVTLGKSYCAAIHTEGDLLLMSLYDRGTVPEERQLAQMLMEVPHHTRTTKTDDPTTIIPGKESFALKQLTLCQAEELASIITAIATGKE